MIELVAPMQEGASPLRGAGLLCCDIDALLAGEAGWEALRVQAIQQLLDERLWREHLFLQCDATERYRALRAARPTWCAPIPLHQQALVARHHGCVTLAGTQLAQDSLSAAQLIQC